jgi:hypothetical protein
MLYLFIPLVAHLKSTNGNSNSFAGATQPITQGNVLPLLKNI